MKKYLIAGALALICKCLLTSCSEDLGNYSSIEEAKKAQFAQNFEKFYGTPDPNQDWGFGEASVVAATRSARVARTRSQGDNSCGECIKSDMPNFPNYSTQYPNYTTPAPITEYERSFVKDWFEKNPGFTSGLNVNNFYIQHVWGEANKTYNVYWNRKTNGQYYRNDFTIQATMDYLCVGNGTDYTHALDFNANDNGTSWKAVYMKNSSALSFKYKSSWSSQEFTYFKCAEINVPGVGTGWYVGLCMYGEKDDNGQQKLNNDMKTSEFCDDWILKVIPGEGSTITYEKVPKVYKKKVVTVHKWVFCEDLGSSATNKDYDYNDLVFDAKIIKEYKILRDADGNETDYTEDTDTTYYAEVTPLAAGGELTIKFDKFSKTAHGMFANGIADNVLINTCRENQEISMSHQEGVFASPEIYEFSSKDDANIDNIKVLVRTQTAAYDLQAYKGEAPHKICVPAGTRWAYERTDIKDAYTGFINYVKTGIEPWSNTGVEENLYPLEAAAYDMRTDMTGTTSYEEVSSLTPVTTYSYTLADATNEHLLWSDVSGNTKFVKNGTAWEGTVAISASDLNAAKIGNGTIIRFYFASENGFTIKATDNTWGDFELGKDNSGWSKNLISGNAKNGYVEFKLDTETANRFKQENNRLIIQGFGLTALALTYDNSQKVADETPEEPNTDDDDGDIIFSGDYTISNSPYYHAVLASSFVGCKEGSILRIYGEPTDSNWTLILKTGWNSSLTFKNQSSNTFNSSNSPIVNGVITLELTAESAQMLASQYSLVTDGNNFRFTKITLKK